MVQLKANQSELAFRFDPWGIVDKGDLSASQLVIWIGGLGLRALLV